MPISPSNSVWTPARIATLTLRWGEGDSAASIAAEIGCGFTRHAVIGAAHRFHLGEHPTIKKNRAQRVYHRTPSVRSPIKHIFPFRVATGPALPPEPIPPPDFLGLTFQQLEQGQCKYPHGDRPYAFCGQPQRDDSPYCEFHHKLCYHRVTPGARISVYRTF